jgi:hypothetical protein
MAGAASAKIRLLLKTGSVAHSKNTDLENLHIRNTLFQNILCPYFRVCYLIGCKSISSDLHKVAI